MMCNLKLHGHSKCAMKRGPRTKSVEAAAARARLEAARARMRGDSVTERHEDEESAVLAPAAHANTAHASTAAFAPYVQESRPSASTSKTTSTISEINHIDNDDREDEDERSEEIIERTDHHNSTAAAAAADSTSASSSSAVPSSSFYAATRAITVAELHDPEAYSHSPYCSRMPATCNCPGVGWIWADVRGSHGVATGKWLLFARRPFVDAAWCAVRFLTARGVLGLSAKVAPASHSAPGRDDHVICVYTSNHNDVADVMRVLLTLRDAAIQIFDKSDTSRVRLNYKSDDATLAGEYTTAASASRAGHGGKKSIQKVSKYFAPRRQPDASVQLLINNIGADLRSVVVAERAAWAQPSYVNLSAASSSSAASLSSAAASSSSDAPPITYLPIPKS